MSKHKETNKCKTDTNTCPNFFFSPLEKWDMKDKSGYRVYCVYVHKSTYSTDINPPCSFMQLSNLLIMLWQHYARNYDIGQLAKTGKLATTRRRPGNILQMFIFG